MNRRSIIIALLLAVIAAGLLFRAFYTHQDAELIGSTDQLIPDFTAIGLETRVFESDGRLAQQIKADKMAHFSALNLTELSNPLYINFLAEDRVNTAETGAIWEVSALSGRFYEGQRLELENNVVILNRSNVGYVEQITTDFITIDLPSRTMFTDSPVTIQGRLFTVSGNGMRVDLEAQQMELIHHVETLYYPRPVQP